MTKVCSKCGIEKDVIEFHKQASGKDGLRASCKDCNNKANREYKQTENGIIKRREWKRSTKGKEASKRYRESNAEKLKEYTRTDAYRLRHRISADKQRFNGNRIKALERDNYKCVACGSTEQIQVHHIDENGRNKPKEERNNDISNLTTLCAKCHIKQHNPVLKRWGY